jgi:hypothetical protein
MTMTRLMTTMLLLGLSLSARAQQSPELRYNFSPDGSRYIKATFLNQTWLRWNQSNPGTTVNLEPQDETFDIGLRRTRMQLFGQLNERVFFYTQFGMNNFNFLAQNAGNRKLQAFFHDALAEYSVFKNSNALKLGGGLTITGGLSRFSQPSIGTIMTTDVPVFLQATVDQTDEFARKLSVYARGQAGRLDYRLALSDPFPVQTNGQPAPAPGPYASFTSYGHSLQYQGFVAWNFLEREPHTTPYMTGTYLGARRILNLEAGVVYQDDATWTQRGGDLRFHDLLLWSVAAYADMPVAANQYAISAYAGYFSTDYGPGYVRNNGIMNPANGNNNLAVFNGGGNAYPMFGTGSSVYTQAGLRLPEGLLGEQGTLMPYVSYRWSDYERLGDDFGVWNGGLNWLMSGHSSKLSLNYERRPIFERQASGAIRKTGHAGSVWLQYQVSL